MIVIGWYYMYLFSYEYSYSLRSKETLCGANSCERETKPQTFHVLQLNAFLLLMHF
jgi:hypothetical protein